MYRRPWRVLSIVGLLVLILGVAPAVYGQGGAVTTTLFGVISDSTGGVVPGAAVVAKDNARGTSYEAVSGVNGAFTIPSLLPGTYTVTVSLQGFKTAVLSNVVLNAGIPASVKAVLEVGALEETVVVEARTELVQTQSAAVAQTINVKQIGSLPLTGRDTFQLISMMSGVNQASDLRSGNIAGLPQSAVNITLDGMNIQDNMNKSTDGMFALVNPRLDAVEEITMSTAANDQGLGAQGATQIRFTTRSGTNKFGGSAYYYYRNEALNANTWFNVRDGQPKAKLLQRQPGFRVGGPIARDKAFFFFNYEEFRSPSDRRLTRTILSPQAQAGNFLYNATDANGNTVVRSVNLLNIAGNISTIDPTVAKLLSDIRNSATAGGTTVTITDQVNPLYQSYVWQNRITSTNRFPVGRVDYNLTTKHRLTGIVHYQDWYTDRDSTNNFDGQFPGFPVYAGQSSKRYTYTAAARSVLNSTMVNEARYGGAGGPVTFWPTLTPDLWNGTLANQAGFQLTLGNSNCSPTCLTNAANSSGNKQARNAYDHVFTDTLSWIKGAHSLQFGFEFSRFTAWMTDTTQVPTISFGIATGDPANNYLVQSNFPGATMADVKNLYAVLTGRITQIAGVARLENGQYAYMGERRQEERMDTMSGFASDSWKLRPNVTLTGALRWDVQLPFTPLNDNFSTATMNDVFGITGVGSDFVAGSLVNHLGNLFKPGVLQGQPPVFTAYTTGVNAYNVDWNNLAPSVGIAYQINRGTSLFRRIIGDATLRGGFSVGFSRNGMGDFQGVYGANPGGSITATRSQANNNLGTPPIMLSNPSQLYRADFPATAVYPMTDVKTQDVSIFDPNTQVPYAQTYSFGFQRALSRNFAMEVRYVGTRSKQGWTTYNYNEINIDNAWNGVHSFYDEFKVAMANLQANIAAGKGNTFAYTGAPGTSPLPIYLAYFTGLPVSAANDPKNYTDTKTYPFLSNFSNSSYYNYLAQRNPNPFSAAGTGTNGLNGTQAYIDNAAKAGLPANLFMVNPDLRGGANVTSNGGYTKYDSVQLELRARSWNGLTAQLGYTWGQQWGSNRYSFKVDRVPTLSTGGGGGVTHAFRATVGYELPFGQGKPIAGGVGRSMNMLVGGWSLASFIRIQSGRLIDLGNVRLVGMSVEDVKALFQLRIDQTTKQKVWMWPQDVIDNTVKAFSVNATSATGYGSQGPPSGRYFAPANGPDCIETIPGGYGQCGTRTLVVTGPMFLQVDLSLVKRINITSRISFDFMAQIQNLTNKANFTPVSGIGSSPDNFEVTGLTGTTARQSQLSFRVNW